MATPPETDADDRGDVPAVTCYETGPNSIVFIEDENADAWIETDVFVEPRR